jgi:hypothetical protein
VGEGKAQRIGYFWVAGGFIELNDGYLHLFRVGDIGSRQPRSVERLEPIQIPLADLFKK